MRRDSITSWTVPFRLTPYLLVLLVATLVGLALRFIGLNWDDGALLNPDEGGLVRGAAELSFPGKLVADFHAYGQLSLVLPWLVTGGSSDPATLSLASRALSAAFATATIPVSAEIARRLKGPLTGGITALLVAFSAPLIGWAHFGTTESAQLLVVTLLGLLSLRYLEGLQSPLHFAVLSGLVAGIGLGMKVSVLSFGIVPAVALLMSRPFQVLHVRAAAIGGSIALLLFFALNPASVLAAKAYWSRIAWENGIVRGTVDVHWTWQFHAASDGLWEARQLWGMLDGTVALLALGGLGMMLWRPDRRSLPILIFLLVYLFLIIGWQAKFVRYLAPVIPTLLVLAAVCATTLVTKLRSSALVGVMALLLLPFIMSGGSRAIGFLEGDPRHRAASYVAAEGRASQRVLYEDRELRSDRFGAVTPVRLPPPDAPEALMEVARLLADADWLILNSRRHWAVLPTLQSRFPGYCGFYRALFVGNLGLKPVRQFQRTPPLSDWVRPTLSTEETRVVFDRPTVLVFRKEVAVPTEDTLLRIIRADEGCDLASVDDARRSITY